MWALYPYYFEVVKCIAFVTSDWFATAIGMGTTVSVLKTPGSGGDTL